jgi:predicted ester cyclase
LTPPSLAPYDRGFGRTLERNERGGAMSEANLTICRRWFEEVWNQRRDDTLEELLSADSISHGENGDVRGCEEFKRYRDAFLEALPDLQVTLEELLAQGDTVVVRWHTVGKHTGEGLGLKPTQRPVAIRGTTWMRVKDGKLIEGWDTWNFDGLMGTLRGS